MKLKFSVAMSVYRSDNVSHFDRALESITTLQTVMPDEIVLVVDGPISEGLNDVIVKYQKMYDIFNVIRLPVNGGLGNALKIAVDNSEHPIIARMDSDDISSPSRFEEQLRYFEQDTDLDIVGGDISEFVDTEENIVAYRKVPADDAEIKKYMKKRSPFNHVSVMYKKTAVQQAGGYLDLFWNEDYYLWIRMIENECVTKNTGTVLVNVRTGADMYRRRGGKRYFQSEKFLQKYMLSKKMIGVVDYITNVLKRWIVQCLVPNWVRGWIYKKIARS